MRKYILHIVYGIILLTSLVMMVVYGWQESNGFSTNGKFKSWLICFCVFAVVGLLYLLFHVIEKKKQTKDEDFVPGSRRKEKAGSVSLEQALHHMSGRKGVVVWDSLWGTFLGFFLLILACTPLFPNLKVKVVLVIVLVLAVILAAGHIIGTLIWKKRSLIPKFIQHNRGIVQTMNEQYYLDTLDQELKEALLYYSKEWILTENYMLGKVDTDIAFHPVAVPREHIKKIIFFERIDPDPHRRYTQGILKCQLYAGKEIEFLIGQGSRHIRVLKVLDQYDIAYEDAGLQ